MATLDLKFMHECRARMLALQAVTGNPKLAAGVLPNGTMRLQEVTYRKGGSDVLDLSSPVPVAGWLAFMDRTIAAEQARAGGAP